MTSCFHLRKVLDLLRPHFRSGNGPKPLFVVWLRLIVDIVADQRGAAFEVEQARPAGQILATEGRYAGWRAKKPRNFKLTRGGSSLRPTCPGALVQPCLIRASTL